eukprot:TRINITY_DN30336_c0_g1_i2.p4 TRINITY_DN30336_c0_g1~~TRINITY_DN30336_c0_g1_i2.p4  ORF type:complete len:154 (-),score=68.22 TRINITY_DN30336_c0_g1_i2:220-681(-)
MADAVPEVFYVWQKKLEVIQYLMKKKKPNVSKAQLTELVEPPENAAEDEIMIPVDMTAFGEHQFEDIDTAVEKLGAVGTATAFLKAQERFDKFVSSLPDGPDKEAAPQKMSMAEWREMVSAEDDDDEDEPDADAAAASSGSAEPAQKKQKTEE